jgi:hypothetical protein
MFVIFFLQTANTWSGDSVTYSNNLAANDTVIYKNRTGVPVIYHACHNRRLNGIDQNTYLKKKTYTLVTCVIYGMFRKISEYFG